MTSEYYLGSSPTSVEFVEGLQSRSSQPIPIKKCRPSPQELQDEAASADSTSYYECATWRMYNRITNARHLRAISTSRFSVQAQHYQPLVMTQEHETVPQERDDLPTTEIIMAHSDGIQLATEDADIDSGVFVFDAV